MEQTTHHLTESGIPGIGQVPWGTHLCLFYRTRDDLLHSLIPYFMEGLRSGEQCLWGTSAPIYADEARAELSRRMPIAEAGRMTIVDYHDWYTAHQRGDPVNDLLRQEERALQAGRPGLRCGGIVPWLTRQDWTSFHAYEVRLNRAVRRRRILTICGLNVDECEGAHIYESMRNHHYALGRRDRDWELLGIVRGPESA